jgi:peroxiredoxin
MTTKLWRAVGFVLIVLVVGYAGLRVGTSLRSRATAPPAEVSKFPFKPGDPLPDVPLTDSLGTTVSSIELVKDRGAVVLFLDPKCEGCLAMAERWQRGVVDGVVEPERIIAVTRDPATINNRYRDEHGFTYPLYTDSASAFLLQHGVTQYPMEMVVGASGTIRSLSTDSKTPIDAASVRALIAQ